MYNNPIKKNKKHFNETLQEIMAIINENDGISAKDIIIMGDLNYTMEELKKMTELPGVN
jgi:glutamate 5-kinase